MKKLGIPVFAALLCAPAAADAGDLRLSIANGRVTIVAQDVTIRQILDEWGRVGQTKVVGAERLTGPSVTLELNDVPEARALEALLRSASGYIAKPRSGTVGTSSYDRILIMPASKPPAMSATPPSFNNPRPQPQVMMPNVAIDDDEGPNGVVPPGQVPMPQQFPTQPGMQPGLQPGQQMPTLTRPGMLPPPAPTVPGNPYQTNPQQPVNPYQTNPQQPLIRPPGVPGPGGPGGGAS